MTITEEASPILSLVTLPLWGLDEDLLPHLLVLLGELASHLGKGGLVASHADSQTLEVRELRGKTDRVSIDEHEVASLASHTVHFEDTTLLHVGLIDQPVDLGNRVLHSDLFSREDHRDLGGTSTNALILANLHIDTGTHSLEQITNGSEATALTLGDVVADLVCSSGSVGLEGQVVVRNLLAVALNSLEHLVGHGLDLLVGASAHLGDHLVHILLADTLALAVTLLADLDGAGKGVRQVSVHGLDVLAHERGLLLARLAPGMSHTSHTLEASLELLGVGSNTVNHGVQLGAELGFGSRQGRLRSSSSTTEGSTLASDNSILGTGILLHLVTEAAGGSREVASSGAAKMSLLGTEHGRLEASLLGESGSLSSSSALVGIEDSTELATGTLGLGVTDVGGVNNATNLLVDTTVNTDLVGAVGGDGTRHNADLTLHASLGILNGGGQGSELHGHLLLGEAHSHGRLIADLLDLLDSVGETHILESGMLGKLVVEETNRGGELGVKLLALLGDAGVELTEAVVGLSLGLLQGTTDLGESSRVATHGGTVSGSEVRLSRATGRRDTGLEGGHIGLHLRSDSTSIACHLGSMAGETGVGLLQALGSLSLEGEESTVLLGHGVANGIGGTTLLGVDLTIEAGTGSSRLTVVASKHSVQGSEAAIGPLHRLLQVGLGTLGSSTDSIEDLLLELGAGSLVLHLESVDAAGGGLAKGGDHGGHLAVKHSTVLELTALDLLQDGESTLLTLLDGSRDGTVDVVAVGLGHGTKHGTALGGFHRVGVDDASQLVDLVLLLPGGADSDGVHAGKTTSEGSLGTTKGVHGIDTGTAGCRHLLAGGKVLHALVACEGSVKLVGGTTQVVGRVATVLGHLVADLGHVHVEGVSHALHAAEGLSLVLGHEGAQLLVLLDVLVVTLVTELHHAHELSMHIAVHLGLLELVAGHSVLESGHAGVELGSLATSSGSELHKTDLELGAGSIDTGSSLVLGIRDVLHSLGEALVLEGLLGAEGGIHAGGGSLEHHVGVVTVLGHASTNLAELGRSGRSDGTDLVVREVAESLVLGSSLGSELGATLLGLLLHVGHLVVEASHGLLEVLASLLRVLTDLGSIRSNVRVGLLDLGIGGRSESGEGTLLVKHSDLKAAGSSTLVLTHDLTSPAGTTDGHGC